MSRLSRSKSSALYAAYTKFEKQHGTRSTLESTVLGKRRIQYEEEVSHDGRNYDVWFDYARLEEGALADLREEGATREEEEQATNRVREVYERAVAQVPPGNEKRFWRRYIFLWLDYALFEEIETRVFTQTFTLVIRQLIFRRIMNEPVRYTKLSSSSSLTKSLPLQNYGFCSPSLRSVDWIYQPPGRYSVPVLGCVRKRRCSRGISSWNSTYVLYCCYDCVPDIDYFLGISFESLTEFGKYTKNTSSGTLPTPPAGSSTRNWSLSWRISHGPGVFSNWVSHNQRYLCPRFCGKRTSISRRRRAKEKRRGVCMRGLSSSADMSRSGFRMLFSRARLSLYRGPRERMTMMTMTMRKRKLRWWKVIWSAPGRCSRGGTKI